MFTNIKLIAAGIGVVAVLALAYTYYSRGEEVKTLTKENANLSTANENLQGTVETTEKSGVITDSTVTKAAEAKEEKRDAHEEVGKKADEKVEEIIREAAKPKAPSARPAVVNDPAMPALTPQDPAVVLDAAVSKVRIDSLWASYCINVPTNPKCAVPVIAQ